MAPANGGEVVRAATVGGYAVAGNTPLVLHGTTGIPDDTVRACVERSVAKINFGTLIRSRFFGYASDAINGAIEHNQHVWRVMEYAGTKIRDEVPAVEYSDIAATSFAPRQTRTTAERTVPAESRNVGAED